MIIYVYLSFSFVCDIFNILHIDCIAPSSTVQSLKITLNILLLIILQFYNNEYFSVSIYDFILKSTY